MELENKVIENGIIVKPSAKRIDTSCSADFKGKMIDCINEGHNNIALDLSDVDFIDSSGLGAMISALKTIGNDGNLVLFGLKETVKSLFRLTRMDRIFKIVESEDEAVKSL